MWGSEGGGKEDVSLKEMLLNVATFMLASKKRVGIKQRCFFRTCNSNGRETEGNVIAAMFDYMFLKKRTFKLHTVIISPLFHIEKKLWNCCDIQSSSCMDREVIKTFARWINKMQPNTNPARHVTSKMTEWLSTVVTVADLSGSFCGGKSLQMSTASKLCCFMTVSQLSQQNEILDIFCGLCWAC